MSAFANCGRAVAHVRGSYVPAAEVDAQFQQFTVAARRRGGRLVTRKLYSPRSSSHKAVSLITTTWYSPLPVMPHTYPCRQ